MHCLYWSCDKLSGISSQMDSSKQAEKEKNQPLSCGRIPIHLLLNGSVSVLGRVQRQNSTMTVQMKYPSTLLQVLNKNNISMAQEFVFQEARENYTEYERLRLDLLSYYDPMVRPVAHEDNYTVVSLRFVSHFISFVCK